jgi:hypothetical protein
MSPLFAAAAPLVMLLVVGVILRVGFGRALNLHPIALCVAIGAGVLVGWVSWLQTVAAGAPL